MTDNFLLWFSAITLHICYLAASRTVPGTLASTLKFVRRYKRYIISVVPAELENHSVWSVAAQYIVSLLLFLAKNVRYYHSPLFSCIIAVERASSN